MTPSPQVNQEKRGPRTLRVYSRRKGKLVIMMRWQQVLTRSLLGEYLVGTLGNKGHITEEPGEKHAGKNTI